MNDSSQAKQPEQIVKPSGSLDNSEPVFLVVGKLRKPHGLRGELRMEVITDFPERLSPGVTVYVGEDYRPMHIRRVRGHDRLLLVAFDELPESEPAGDLRNQMVYVRSDDRPKLPDGEYYHHQLLGLHVISDEGEDLGRLVKILETGANDVYIVRPLAGRDLLLPAIDDVIQKVDLQAGCMQVHLLPGLIPD